MRESAVNSANGPVPVLMLRVSSAVPVPVSNPANDTAPALISTEPLRGGLDPIQTWACAAAGQAVTISSAREVIQRGRAPGDSSIAVFIIIGISNGNAAAPTSGDQAVCVAIVSRSANLGQVSRPPGAHQPMLETG
jgi:hypothetical protein